MKLKKLDIRGFSHDVLAMLFIVIFVICGVGYLVASHADTSTSNIALYKCSPRDPGAIVPKISPPKLVSQAAALDDTQKSYPSLCPAGEVPNPTALGAPSKLLPNVLASQAGKAPPRTSNSDEIDGYNYSWSQGQQYLGNTVAMGLYADMAIEQPYVNFTHSSYNHSLGQIWALDNSDPYGYSDIEVGWMESLGQFHDYGSHLFVYHFDQSVAMGYAPAGGWVQLSNSFYPNMPLEPSNELFGVQRYGSVWLVYFDNQWIGYYPASAYPRHFPNSITNAEVGGEVAALEPKTCTDMGDSYRGTNSNASPVYYVFWTNYNDSAGYIASLTPHNSDPSVYTTGQWGSNSSFRFGGPGWC